MPAPRSSSKCCRADRVKLLPQINEHFQALKRDNDNVARATIVSAFPLTDQQRDELKGALAKRYGRQIETVEKLTPACSVAPASSSAIR